MSTDTVDKTNRQVQSLRMFRDYVSMSSITTHELTLGQIKFWLALGYHVRDDLKNETRHAIPLDKLIEDSGYLRKDGTYLIEQLKKLMKTIISCKPIGKSKGALSGRYSPLLSYVDFDSRPGYMLYEFSPLVREVFNHDSYSDISLELIKMFDTKSGLSLYRLANRFRNCFQTPEIPLDQLKGILGCEVNQYKEFKHFNESSLRVALKEVKKISDLDLTAEFIKTKRKVTAVRFKIKPKKSVLVLMPLENKQKKAEKARPYINFTDAELQESFENLSSGHNHSSASLSERNLVRDELKTRGIW